jgi:hypothetical protein
MRARQVLLGAAAVLGAVALLRMQRESRRVRAGSLDALGAAGTTEREDRGDALHRTLGVWQPTPPRTLFGRVVAGLWSAPLTALGMVATALGGQLPRWDADLQAFVATSLRGPFSWFLRLQGAAAATLGQVVVLRGDAPSAALLRHEVQHVRQQERLGPLFAIAYPLAGARWGYRNTPFEVAARRAARHGRA